jgi:hypothetical protein
MQVAAPEPGSTRFGSENVCRDSGRRNEAAQAAGVRIAHLACLKARERPWLEGCTGRASHYALTVMHVHHGRVSLSRTLRFLSASERFSQPRELGKTAGIDAGRGLSPVMSRTGRPDREVSQESAPPSQVRATLEHPAASGERASRPAPAMRGRGAGSVLGVHPEPA